MALKGNDHVTITNKLIPSKVRIFCWKARLDRLPTKVNLIKKELISLTMDARCVVGQAKQLIIYFLIARKQLRQDRSLTKTDNCCRILLRTWKSFLGGWVMDDKLQRTPRTWKTLGQRTCGDCGLEEMSAFSKTMISILLERQLL